MIISFSYQVKLKGIGTYMCHAGKHKVPKSQRWRCCTYTKQVLPNNKESNKSYIERKRENFCLFDLTFFVQNVIFQCFRICGFRQQQVIDPSSESLHRKKTTTFLHHRQIQFSFSTGKKYLFNVRDKVCPIIIGKSLLSSMMQMHFF